MSVVRPFSPIIIRVTSTSFSLKPPSVDFTTTAASGRTPPKIDDVALEILLRSPVAYIGALGSRVTQEKRRKELRELKQF